MDVIKSIMEEFFYLLECNPVKDLLFLFDLEENIDYIIEKQNNFAIVKVILTDERTKILKEVIQDMNIFIPQVSKYLSDYILIKERPTESILKYVNLFSSDDLFLPYISKQRVYKAELKHCRGSKKT